MDLSALREPLTANQIDFRIQSVNKGGYATILAYKDARADMARLDRVVGPLNWQRQHYNGNHNCRVGIWSEAIKDWVWKDDVGSESNTEAAKGLASDSFKRACFNWGIGRELYDYPVIQVKLHSHEWEMRGDKPVTTWKLKLREWLWYSEFTDGDLTFLAARDSEQMRFKWGEMKNRQKEKAA